jgi:hypothetical protein
MKEYVANRSVRRSLGTSAPTQGYNEIMTPEDQQRVAEGAIRFGPYDKSEAAQFIASTLKLDALEVESTLEELQSTKIIKIIAASRNVATGEPAQVNRIQFSKGMYWPEDWKDFPPENLGLRL